MTICYSMVLEKLTRDTDESTIRRRTMGAHCRVAKADVDGNIQ